MFVLANFQCHIYNFVVNNWIFRAMARGGLRHRAGDDEIAESKENGYQKELHAFAGIFGAVNWN